MCLHTGWLPVRLKYSSAIIDGASDTINAPEIRAALLSRKHNNILFFSAVHKSPFGMPVHHGCLLRPFRTLCMDKNTPRTRLSMRCLLVTFQGETCSWPGFSKQKWLNNVFFDEGQHLECSMRVETGQVDRALGGEFVTEVLQSDNHWFVPKTGYSKIRKSRRGVPTPRLDSHYFKWWQNKRRPFRGDAVDGVPVIDNG